MQNTGFNIYVMSYRRSDRILSKSCFEYCTYVVREEEEELYRAAGVDDLLVIPESANVFDFMSTLYWIIENTPERVIYVADDDISGFLYRTEMATDIVVNGVEPDRERIASEVERIAQLLVDLDLGLAFDQPQLALYSYDRPFGVKGTPGHMRWINKDALKAKYDPRDAATSDIDMMMQELLHNRIVLQPKYLCCKAGMDTNKGAIEDRSEHIAMVYAMMNKWGKYYEYDMRRNIPHINVNR